MSPRWGFGIFVYQYYRHVAPLGLNEPMIFSFTHHVINSCKLAPLVNIVLKVFDSVPTAFVITSEQAKIYRVKFCTFS